MLLHELLARSAALAESSYFQAHDLNFKLVLFGDFLLEPLEGGAGEFLDFPAAEAGEVEMLLLGSDFVVVFFALDVHEVEFVDHAHALEEFDGAVDGGAVDIGVALAGLPEEAGGIEMAGGFLDGLDECPTLGGKADAAAFEGVEEVVAS